MPVIWRPATHEVLSYWVKTIITEASEDLTDWETTFIEDMERKIDLKMQLTKAQQDKLESIYAAKTK